MVRYNFTVFAVYTAGAICTISTIRVVPAVSESQFTLAFYAIFFFDAIHSAIAFLVVGSIYAISAIPAIWVILDVCTIRVICRICAVCAFRAACAVCTVEFVCTNHAIPMIITIHVAASFAPSALYEFSAWLIRPHRQSRLVVRIGRINNVIIIVASSVTFDWARGPSFMCLLYLFASTLL